MSIRTMILEDLNSQRAQFAEAVMTKHKIPEDLHMVPLTYELLKEQYGQWEREQRASGKLWGEIGNITDWVCERITHIEAQNAALQAEVERLRARDAESDIACELGAKRVAELVSQNEKLAISESGLVSLEISLRNDIETLQMKFDESKEQLRTVTGERDLWKHDYQKLRERLR